MRRLAADEGVRFLFFSAISICYLCAYYYVILLCYFFFSSRRRHTRCLSDWSSDVCSSDLAVLIGRSLFTTRTFAPITTVILFPNVLVVNKDLPIKTAQDLIALTRSKPGKINYGTSGTGSTNHLTTELYRISTNVELNYVPYRGGAPAMTDLMGGQIQAMFASMPSASSLIKAGSIRALMVTDSKRWDAIPDIPSASEAGLPGVHVISFNGVLAPAGTPSDIIGKLHSEI